MIKKKVVPIVATVGAAVIAAVTLAQIQFMRMDIVAMEMSQSDWQLAISSYDMLSPEIRSVISEQEFNDRTEYGRYHLYRRLSEIEEVPRKKGDWSTEHWKTPPSVDVVSVDEGTFFAEITVDYRVHWFDIEVINFRAYLYRLEIDEDNTE